MSSPSSPDSSVPTDVERHGDAGRRVLLAYYTYTQQARTMSDAMADSMRERGCEVTQAAIEFTDRRYVERVTRFPMRHALLDVLRMLPPQMRRKTGEIRIPPEAQDDSYDLVCILSPTWWLTTCMPIRSFMKAPSTGAVLAGTPFTEVVVCRRYWGNNHRTVRDLGVGLGGEYVEGIHFRYAGGQIRSLLSLVSYLGRGTYRDRYLGVPIPRTNLSSTQLDEGRAFARRLVDRLQVTAPAA